MHPFPNIASEIATKIFILGTTTNCLMTELTGSLLQSLRRSPKEKRYDLFKVSKYFFQLESSLHCWISVGEKDAFRTSLGNERKSKWNTKLNV